MSDRGAFGITFFVILPFTFIFAFVAGFATGFDARDRMVADFIHNQQQTVLECDP